MRLKLAPKLILLSSLSLLTANTMFAQDSAKVMTASDSLKWAFAKIDSLKTATTVPKPKNSLTISVELRTRSEFRHGYRSIPTEDTAIAFFTAQRTRLNFAYATKGLDLYLSLQDARVWGIQDPRNPLQPSYLFEAYAEPHFSDKFSVRIGRQRILYDNQRLFAENDWRTAGASHDAMRFVYNNKINFNSELVAAYNQSAENTFGTSYKPTGFINYKVLGVHYLNWKLNNNFTLTTINAADGYQSSQSGKSGTTFMRYTSGGRLEFSSYNWYLTFSGYYQYGKDSSGKKIAATYYQPEIKYTGFKNLTLRLGAEYLSGHDGTQPATQDNNFVPLYGVAHRFMGNLDLFTTFPSDVNNAGLVNPYLFIWYAKGKWAVRFDHHLFYTQNNFVSNGATIKKYLGYENDWRINYKPISSIDVEFGFCWATVTNSMTIIKKGGSETTKPYWSYLSLKFSPTIGKFTF